MKPIHEVRLLRVAAVILVIEAAIAVGIMATHNDWFVILFWAVAVGIIIVLGMVMAHRRGIREVRLRQIILPRQKE